MNAKEIVILITPISIFILKRYISILITIPLLIIFSTITYYLYVKSGNKYFKSALALFGLDFLFIIIGILFHYL